ncbi:MAG: DAK2 domain-containing protein, partial [Lachnospiraceae bacterium]|nr:DAK2 domain-containing protein [Lachnospiraceae bacterium]
NSGVILSQLLRGFTRGIGEYEELTPVILARACNKATETAYKAVMKPKEGTILTVAKGASEKALELAKDKTITAAQFADEVLSHAEYVLSETPNMLPVLKEAGVVDSGGKGLVEVLRGIADLLNGRKTEINIKTGVKTPVSDASGINKEVVAAADIKFGYCTEFILETEKPFTEKDEKDMKRFLESIGDSIVCVAMDEIVKVHVHTNHPGLVFEEALKYGALTSLKVDNMRKEHNERLFKLEGGKYKEKTEDDTAAPEEAPAEEKKPYGFVTVSSGEGLSEVFKGLGADRIIAGGQTMNPSTDDLLQAINSINADVVYVLPNNKNIVLAAKQAAQLAEGREVIVIPSKTIPQGITAMINFIPDYSAEENKEAMCASLESVKSGEVTYAVRDTEIDGKKIANGDIMGIDDKGICAVGKEIEDTTIELIDNLADEDSEVITIYYGEGMSEDDAESLRSKVEEKYSDAEVEATYGGQPVYYYVVSVE